LARFLCTTMYVVFPVMLVLLKMCSFVVCVQICCVACMMFCTTACTVMLIYVMSVARVQTASVLIFEHEMYCNKMGNVNL
jgi:hypothetical protein